VFFLFTLSEKVVILSLPTLADVNYSIVADIWFGHNEVAYNYLPYDELAIANADTT
jgi:hypothetical protein